MNYEALWKELTRQAEARRLQATDMYLDLTGNDPAVNLQLDSYQKGVFNGRIAAFEFFCSLISELKMKAETFETNKEKDKTSTGSEVL